MSDSVILGCPDCSAINRVSRARLDDGPTCGKCKQRLFTGEAVPLTSANFHALVERSELPVVVDFWAAWCGPCKMMAPIFADAARELEPRMRFAKLDTEAEQALAGRFGIRSIPTLIVFKNGGEATRQPGLLQGTTASAVAPAAPDVMVGGGVLSSSASTMNLAPDGANCRTGSSVVLLLQAKSGEACASPPSPCYSRQDATPR